MSQSLKYVDYEKRRLSGLLPINTTYSFFNPIHFNGQIIRQVEININKLVRIFDGVKWEACEDEELLYVIICRLVKKESQKEIEFKEAV